MPMNVPVDRLTPGVAGLSRGGGLAGDLVRMATQAEVGHAFLYLGGGQIVQGMPPRAALAPAGSHGDATWAWRMWDALREDDGWPGSRVADAQGKVIERGKQLVGVPYDAAAYAAFAAEVLRLRNDEQLAGYFAGDSARVCSALVADALTAGGVPLDFIPSDGPGLVAHPGQHFVLPPNLVAPGMLLGLAIRKRWV